MKRWQKIIVFTLILALPISLWTSVTMASHCQSSDDTSHAMHMNDDDLHEHLHDQVHLQDDTTSDHSSCECGCNGSFDCSISGCSASIITSTIKFDLKHLSKSIFQQIQVRAEPSDPNLLFRPPIISS